MSSSFPISRTSFAQWAGSPPRPISGTRAASLTSLPRFYDIAWGPPDADHPRGIIAAALENGALDLYDAEKLASGASDALIERATKHSGSIKTVQFNPLKPQILATAGAKGELFIYNIEDIQNPFRLGNAAASRADDIECLAWNKKVSHILATGGSGGLVTVWDVKTKKASLTLNNNRKPVSSIAWDPTNSTKLITASSDDNTPVIYLWNLRNSNAPEKTLTGHEQGVLSLSWCPQDPTILLSCGKDNRTLVWNPNTGETFGELQEGTNWAFLTRFNPSNPNLTATASFDGKITVQTLQNTNNSADAQAAAQSSMDAEDFFASVHTAPKVANFSLPNPPAWYLKPVGATFGFGGKVTYFTLNDTPAGQTPTSTVHIAQFSADSDVAPTTEKFEETLQSGDVKAICESHIQQAKTEEEKADWEVLETLLDANPRQKVVERLGFKKGEENTNGVTDATDTKEVDTATTAAEESEAAAASKKDNRLSNFFDGGEDGDGDDFLAGLSSGQGAKSAQPFHLFGQGNTHLEDTITKAVMLGDFTRAVDICLKENRIADAFVIANCGGKDLVQKVQAAYLTDSNGSPSYIRLLGSIISEDLWDVVHNADLANWKEALATLCTFAKPADFPAFCEGLGDRVLEARSRKDASFCYLVGSKLEKVVDIWIAELEEAEQAGVKEGAEDSSFSVHTKSLQQFIEKVTVFRHVTKFDDREASLTAGWKLASLYDKYIEYADIVASAGLMAVAQKYLDLVPTTYEAAELARNRVKLAIKKPAAQQRGSSTMTQNRTAAARTPLVSAAYPATQTTAPSLGGSTPPNPYSAPAPVVSSNPYAPAGVSQANPYAPSTTPSYGGQGYAHPHQASAYAPPAGAYGAAANLPYGAPPRNPTPSAPPPPRAKDVGSWNDVPMVTKVPARKTTPSVAPITMPFGAQSLSSGPPPPYSPHGASSRGAPTPPPPPKGPAPLRVTSPLVGPTHGGPPPSVASAQPRPASSATNAYAPPPPSSSGPIPGLPHPPPRMNSPYNPPPVGAPPPSRYAPVAAAEQVPSAGFSHNGPPIGGPPRHAPIGPPPMSGPPPSVGGPPRATPGVAAAAATPPPPQTTAPPPRKAKHPPGDRSHIPPKAQKLVQILDADLQRVAARAPETFKPQVNDTRKRLNLLFDHLNNAELVKEDTVQQLHEIAEAIERKAYDHAQKLQVEIHRDKPEECGNWMVSLLAATSCNCHVFCTIY